MPPLGDDPRDWDRFVDELTQLGRELAAQPGTEEARRRAAEFLGALVRDAVNLEPYLPLIEQIRALAAGRLDEIAEHAPAGFMAKGTLTVGPVGIPSAEAFGTATVTLSDIRTEATREASADSDSTKLVRVFLGGSTAVTGSFAIEGFLERLDANPGDAAAREAIAIAIILFLVWLKREADRRGGPK